jgi:hypothetical protein
VPGSSTFCQIGIGTDTLSVGVDMPGIADALLVGDIDDADEGFQKLGRTGQRKDLVGDPRGIIYTTAAAYEAEEQALAAAKVDMEAETASTRAGHNPTAGRQCSAPSVKNRHSTSYITRVLSIFHADARNV